MPGIATRLLFGRPPLADLSPIRATRRLPPNVPECTDRDRIAALEAEAILLRPYASTIGLRRLKARLADIESAIRRLRGLALGDDDA
jgi:hypothetical protein